MKKRLYILLFTIFSINAFAVDLELSKKDYMVTDCAKIFNNLEFHDLEFQLRSFNESSPVDIFILTVDNLKGYNISDYAKQVSKKWRNRFKREDGLILIVVENKINDTKGGVYIVVEDCLKDIISDMLIEKIVKRDIYPYLEDDNYYTGVKIGVDNIIALVTGEYIAEKAIIKNNNNWMFIIFPPIIIILFAIIRRKLKKRF